MRGGDNCDAAADVTTGVVVTVELLLCFFAGLGVIVFSSPFGVRESDDAFEGVEVDVEVEVVGAVGCVSSFLVDSHDFISCSDEESGLPCDCEVVEAAAAA